MAGVLTRMLGAAVGLVYSIGSALSGDTTAASSSDTLVYTSAGLVQETVTTGGTLSKGNWILPASFAPGAYTVRAHQNSGTISGGSALDTDLALSSNRSWFVTQVGTGSKTCTLLITIKDGGGVTVASGTMTLSATAL